jgi:hypothetical protein
MGDHGEDAAQQDPKDEIGLDESQVGHAASRPPD